MHAQILAGVRVIDATSVLAGPYATYQLALLGAEVIKVEKPGAGDFTRAGGEPIGDSGLNAQYAAQNAGKRTISIDLSQSRSPDAWSARPTCSSRTSRPEPSHRMAWTSRHWAPSGPAWSIARSRATVRTDRLHRARRTTT